jgi:hypothetical protein
MQFSECNEAEYRYHYGLQCISKGFLHDDIQFPGCYDWSHEIIIEPVLCYVEPNII